MSSSKQSSLAFCIRDVLSVLTPRCRVYVRPKFLLKLRFLNLAKLCKKSAVICVCCSYVMIL